MTTELRTMCLKDVFHCHSILQKAFRNKRKKEAFQTFPLGPMLIRKKHSQMSWLSYGQNDKFHGLTDINAKIY